MVFEARLVLICWGCQTEVHCRVTDTPESRGIAIRDGLAGGWSFVGPQADAETLVELLRSEYAFCRSCTRDRKEQVGRFRNDMARLATQSETGDEGGGDDQ